MSDASIIIQLWLNICLGNGLDMLPSFLSLYPSCHHVAYLSMLMAHKLRIDAVQSKTSNDIQISQNIQPSCQEPENDNLMLYLIIFTPRRKGTKKCI